MPFERLLFPRSRLVDAALIIVLSGLFSWLLTGRQIVEADWGLIDDHQIFQMLGSRHRLPLGEIWDVAVHANTQGQIFRPVYYLVVAAEAAAFGDNVHLWYLVNTVMFAIFLASVWWVMLRFVGGWLAGALTIWIALLPLWAGIWSRLGPSEIQGATVLGIIMLCASGTLRGSTDRSRSLAAVALAILGVLMAGIKETFLPLAFGPLGVLIVAAATRRISLKLGCVLSAFIFLAVGVLGIFVLRRAGANGVDYYGKSIGMVPILSYAALGVFMGLLQSFWLWAFPLMSARALNVISRERLTAWFSRERITLSLYAILVLMFAGQCGIYRRLFPTGGRYDFPAMLLVPFTCCLIAAALSRELRTVFSERLVQHVQLFVAVFATFALVTANLGSPPALATAVNRNIRTTRHFGDVLHRAVAAATAQPSAPIILEAYGPDAYEPVISMDIYLRTFGVRNPIAVRLHPQPSGDAFAQSLEHGLQDLQSGQDPRFVDLATVQGGSPCISVGLFGEGAPACLALEIGKGP